LTQFEKSFAIRRTFLEKEFLDITDLSQYLNIKESTLYAKVEGGILPHYRIGRLIRFKKPEIDHWMEGQRKSPRDIHSVKMFKPKNNSSSIDRIVRKAIDLEKGMQYNPVTGKPDQIKGPGKEGNNGAL
jgi:excisionase family DNA binding protein